MEILISHDQGRVPVTIFRLVGRINLGNVDELVKNARQAFDGGARDLLIDLGEVPTITSAGIRALTEIYKLFNPFSLLPRRYHARPQLGRTLTQRMLVRMNQHSGIQSGRRDSNPRPSPWQGDALPLSHFRLHLLSDGWGNLVPSLRSDLPRRCQYQLGTAGPYLRPWGRRDSNSHGFLHMILNHARLPFRHFPVPVDFLF